MATASDCLFCKIGQREIDSDVVQETDGVVAFRDVNPQAPTHVLVIPKDHIPSAAALGEEHADVLAEIFRVASHVAKAEGVDDSGWRLVTNVGADAGQSVPHLHFHVLGGRSMRWPPG